VINIGIVGGTGYTGAELLRLLSHHPDANVSVITSRGESGNRVDSLYPSLRGFCDLQYSTPDAKALLGCDVVFFATPHGVAQSMMKELIDGGARVIDLSADFRIRDIDMWEKWYSQTHACPELVDQAVYGLPERNREAIKNAQLVACPGCYPTSIQLALMPVLEAGLVDATTLISSSASGISGAGRNANTGLLMAENYDSFKAYAVAGHRHLPEVEQGLRDMQCADDSPARLTFVPHLLPTIRGIHSTIYARLKPSVESAKIQALYEGAYANEPFVDVLPRGVYPEMRSVKGTNICRISAEIPQGGDVLVIMSVIDNLAKGASAQAIQNMNLMFGFDERTGLNFPALIP
jgi:N-acetyl-gamma-glutamyl-phosphate reductase